MVQSGLEHCLFSIFRRISAATPVPERASLEAELEQLYAESKYAEILAPWQGLPKDGEGKFITSQERSDVVHDLLAFLAERMLEMNKQKRMKLIS